MWQDEEVMGRQMVDAGGRGRGQGGREKVVKKVPLVPATALKLS